MRDKTDGGFTVSIASSVQKTLRSRYSAERLVRAIVGMWREKSVENNEPSSLILDFDGIFRLPESVADVLVHFRYEFPGGNCSRVEFLNVSAPVRKALASAEKSLGQFHKRVNVKREKKSGFMIEI